MQFYLKTFVAVLALSLASLASVTVTVTPVGTQAVFSYTAPDTSACTVDVFSDAGKTLEVNDTNTSLFSGSNSDQTRYSFNASKTARYFVVGQPTINSPGDLYPGMASDGKIYSRALQVNTTYYYTVTCSGGNTGTGSFTTQNIPLGTGRAKVQPVLSPGVYAYPTFAWTRTASYIDPNYGTKLQHLSLPNDDNYNENWTRSNVAFTANGTCTGWTTPANLLSNTGNASVSSTSPCDISVGGSGINTNWGSGARLDGIKITFTGSASGGTVDADKTISVCVKLNSGTTCVNNAQSKTQVLTGTPASYTLGPSTHPSVIDVWVVPPGPNVGTVDILNNANFGVVINKTNATGSVSLQNFKVTVYESWFSNGQDNGAAFSCSHAGTVSDGTNTYYLCSIVNGGSALAGFYTVNTSTGQVHYIGRPQRAGTAASATVFNGDFGANGNGGAFDGQTVTRYWGLGTDNSSNTYVMRCELPASPNAAYGTDAASGAQACSSVTNVTPTPVGTMFNTFNSGYVAANFNGVGLADAQSHYLLFYMRKGQQDSISWLGVMDITNPAAPVVSAMTDMYARSAFRWCGYHTAHQMDSVNLLGFSVHQLNDNGSAGYLGSGTPSSNLSGSLPNNCTQATITLTNPGAPFTTSAVRAFNYPTSQYDINVYGTTPAVAVGDRFIFLDNQLEQFTIASITSDSQWVVNRCQDGSPSSAHTGQLFMYCNRQKYNSNSNMQYWDFINDPTGTGIVIPEDHIGGHGGVAYGTGAGEDLYVCDPYSLPTPCPSPKLVNPSPGFAGGSTAFCSGNACQSHPTPAQQKAFGAAADSHWSIDLRAIDYGTDMGVGRTITADAGSLFHSTSSQAGGIDLKHNALVGWVGSKILQDISPGPILTTSADYYKMCYAYKAGDCYAGSSAGNIYVNAPGSLQACQNAAWPIHTGYVVDDEFCFGNAPVLGSTSYQFLLNTASNDGSTLRPLTSGFTPYHYYSTAGPATGVTPDGKYGIVTMYTPDYNLQQMLLQLPPMSSATTRNDYSPQTITIPQHAASTTTVVQFGYNPNFYCTSRQEVCVATTGSYSQSTPFYFATSDSGSYTGVDCSAGSCNVVVPAIKGEVLYYRYKYTDGTFGPTTVMAIQDTNQSANTSVIPGGGTIPGGRVIR